MTKTRQPNHFDRRRRKHYAPEKRAPVVVSDEPLVLSQEYLAWVAEILAESNLRQQRLREAVWQTD